MESKQKQQQRQKPKLERRNAIKNIDYQVDDSSTSSSIRTRSLDVSFYASSSDNRTSFRIVGGSDAEIDRICWNLGLSGPEDFAIPTAAWEARKTKSSSSATSSSSIFPHSRFHQLSQDTPPSPPSTADIGIELKQDEDDEVKGKELSTGDSSTGPTKNVSSSSSSSIGGARGGIKGVRPPTLAPPPSILLPPIDDNLSGSTWDILRDFGPPQDNNRSASKAQIVDTTSSSDDDDHHHKYPIEEEEEESSRAIVEREEDLVRLGETSLHLSESCSFSDEGEDGDSSSTTTDPMYVISPNAISRFRRNINSWTKGTLLGSGSFGTVYEGLSEDGFFFAVKEVSLLDQGIQAKQSIHQLEQEISLLSQFEHENIVQYLGTDKDDGKLYIFLELVTQGSLAQLYQKYHLPENLVSAYTRQILHGLKYLHDRNVVHRDIKCANILVDASGYVKLADFGLAKATKFNDVKSCKGTAFWMAPEVVNRRNHGYGLPADIWSLGCTVLEMLTRQLPYLNLECMQALFRIGRGKPPPIPDSISGAARDFILKCLQVNADDRPTAALLLEHAFVDRPSSAPSGSVSPAHNNWRRT